MGTVEEREKARNRPIDGKYPEFAAEVRRLLGYDGDRPFLTSRVAARKTGVNYSTVSAMVRGDRASASNIQKFADVLGGDADLLLSLAGFLPTSYTASRPMAPAVVREQAAPYTIDPEVMTMLVDAFSSVPLERARELAVELAEKAKHEQRS